MPELMTSLLLGIIKPARSFGRPTSAIDPAILTKGEIACLMHVTGAHTGGSHCLGARKPVLKSLLLYPNYFYWYLLASNLLLRLSWTYKLSPHLRVNYNTVMLFTLLEVCVLPLAPS